MAVLRWQRYFIPRRRAAHAVLRLSASDATHAGTELKGTDEMERTEDFFPAPKLVFDSPLLADSLGFGADSSKVSIAAGSTFTDKTDWKRVSAHEVKRGEAMDDPIVPTRSNSSAQAGSTSWARPDRRAVAMALQPAEALPPPQSVPNPPIRQPVRSLDSFLEEKLQVPFSSSMENDGNKKNDEQAEPVESKLGPIYTWTPAMQEEFIKVFETESRRSSHEANLRQSATHDQTAAPVSDFDALAELLVGEWESVHERGRLRIHVIERDGFGGLLQRSRDIGADRRLGQQAESLRVRIRLQPSGEVTWGQGHVMLDRSSLGKATLIWRHNKGHKWEWIRRDPSMSATRKSSTTNLEVNPIPERRVEVSHPNHPIEDGKLERLCDLIIEAFSNHQLLQRRPALPSAALDVARSHAAAGNPVTLAAELYSIERNGLKRHRPVRVFAELDETRIREDTIQVLFSSASVLSWPRLRALLLAGVRTSGGSTLSAARV